MSSYSTLKRITLMALLGACLLAVSGIQRELNRIKDEKQLVIREHVENMTPVMAFCTGALGGFRGIIADILFLRLQFLQDKDRFFEINELGHMILQLQPDMPEATSFLAWNMAYNISVKFSRHEDRWRWVRRGIELIRDKALTYNSTDPVPYHQLGWMYQHKIGEVMDDANLYYKGQLALQMIEVLGKKDRYDWDRLAAAPNDEDQLKILLGKRLLKRIALKDPERDDDALTNALVNVAKNYESTGRLTEFWESQFTAYDILNDAKAILGSYKGGNRQALQNELESRLIHIGSNSDLYRDLHAKSYIHRKLEAEFRKTSDQRPTGGLPKQFVEAAERLGLSQILDDYFRSRWLREVYKLDADRIPEIFAITGYLDFRTPYSHGIYWAQAGLRHSPGNKKLHRMVQQCLYSSAKWGQLQYVSAEGVAILMPNFDTIAPYFEVYEKQPEITTGDKAGAENFLKDTIVLLYIWGETKKAEHWFSFLKNQPFGKRAAYRNKSLEDFAVELAAQDINDKGHLQISGILMGMAVQYLRALAFDDEERAERLITMLKRVHQRYYEDATSKRQIERIKVPTLDIVLIEAKYLLMQNAPSRDIAERFWKVGPDLRKVEAERRKNFQENMLKKDGTGKMKIQRK